MSRYEDLKAQLERLTLEVEEARKTEASAAMQTCRELIGKFGLTPFDVGFVKTQIVAPKAAKPKTFGPAPAKRTFAPKYRNPETGETWTGMGKAPGWINGNRDDFLIANA